MDGGSKIIIVKKKKEAHTGHHGGSWKVAYADFVTAMMAFFLVMWIMGMDQGVKDIVQGYFSNPVGFKKSYSGGLNPMSAGNAPMNIDLKRENLRWREQQRSAFEESAVRIQLKLEQEGLAGMAAAVEVVVTEEGLRIEIMETDGVQTFFARSSAAIQPTLESVLTVVAAELGALPNPVVVEGHTDALPFVGGRTGYTNWELSVDRANAARHALERFGLDADRIVEVRGYADKHPKIPARPLDPRNRRISLLLPYESAPEVRYVSADSAVLTGPGASR